MNIPYLIINKCYHVGEFDLSKKTHDSYEGFGLSVSLNPHEWIKIAKLQGDINAMEHKHGIFADYYEVSSDDWKEIIQWGINNNYVEMGDIYKVEWYDDEWEQDFHMLFESYEDAEEEGKSELIKGLKATEKMNKKMKHKVCLASVKDFLFLMYIDEETDFDGVWWNEILDVNLLSAPRGCILPKKLNAWNIG